MSVKTISLAEIQQRLQRGEQPIIFDVRTPAEFAAVHATGARLMPLDQLNAEEIRRSTNPDGSIYIICHSGSRAAKACEKLTTAGINSVYSIEGGTAAWEKAGLPVERSQSGTISLERQVRIVAGSITLLGALLTYFFHPLFFTIPAFIGAGLTFAGITDFCGMAMLLAKMPWNRTSKHNPHATACAGN